MSLASRAMTAASITAPTTSSATSNHATREALLALVNDGWIAA